MVAARDSPSGIDPIIYSGRVQAYQCQEAAPNWRVIIIRSRGEYLGSVEAPDRERAEAVAIKLFDLDQDQRSRLLIRERQ